MAVPTAVPWRSRSVSASATSARPFVERTFKRLISSWSTRGIVVPRVGTWPGTAGVADGVGEGAGVTGAGAPFFGTVVVGGGGAVVGGAVVRGVVVGAA